MSVKTDDSTFDEDIKNLIGQVEQGLLLAKTEESHLPMKITISDDEEVEVEPKKFATSRDSQAKGRRQLDFCKERKRNSCTGKLITYKQKHFYIQVHERITSYNT
jgi:hypothetical protein